MVIQTFIPESAIEPLDESILGRFASLDQLELNPSMNDVMVSIDVAAIKAVTQDSTGVSA